MKASLTVLYVDDDHDDLFLLTDAFQQHATHLRMIHAANGRDALRVLKKMAEEGTHPCLVILDINMPVMNGKEALAEIRNEPRFRQLPVVLFSTSNSPADRRYAESMGADFITKPVHFTDMKELVERFVNRCLVAA